MLNSWLAAGGSWWWLVFLSHEGMPDAVDLGKTSVLKEEPDDADGEVRGGILASPDGNWGADSGVRKLGNAN